MKFALGLIHTTRKLLARKLRTQDGEPIVRVQVNGRLFPLHEDLNAAEASTLGAALLGFGVSQGGMARAYAESVVQQLVNVKLPAPPAPLVTTEDLDLLEDVAHALERVSRGDLEDVASADWTTSTIPDLDDLRKRLARAIVDGAL